MDATAFNAAPQRWVRQIVPSLTQGEVVVIDGKTSRRSGTVGKLPLHLVSAFAAGAQLVLGQRATAEKSNEKTAIPELLATLALEGCIVSIDAMGTQPNIAQAIRDRGTDYILSVKDNQLTLADSMRDFFATFQTAPKKTPHQVDESVEKNHGRLEVRRCYSFDQLDCLHALERWPGQKSFAVIASERTLKGKTTLEHRYYITSLLPDAAHNLSVVRHFALKLIRYVSAKRKGGLKVQCLRAAFPVAYREELLGLLLDSRDCPVENPGFDRQVRVPEWHHPVKPWSKRAHRPP